MNTGTSRASARAEIDVICSTSGSALQQRIGRIRPSVAPSFAAEDRLDFACRGGRRSARSVFEPGG